MTIGKNLILIYKLNISRLRFQNKWRKMNDKGYISWQFNLRRNRRDIIQNKKQNYLKQNLFTRNIPSCIKGIRQMNQHKSNIQLSRLNIFQQQSLRKILKDKIEYIFLQKRKNFGYRHIGLRRLLPIKQNNFSNQLQMCIINNRINKQDIMSDLYRNLQDNSKQINFPNKILMMKYRNYFRQLN